MELLVTGTEGIPEDSILSVRAGATRRQAPVTPAHPFKFPTGPDDANPFKVDVLAPIGGARLILKPGEEKYTIPIESEGEEASHRNLPPMSVTLAVKENTDGRKCSPAKRHTQASAARTYLDEHNLVEFAQSLLQSVIKEKPEHPYTFMAKQFHLPDPKPRPNTCPPVLPRDSAAAQERFSTQANAVVAPSSPSSAKVPVPRVPGPKELPAMLAPSPSLPRMADDSPAHSRPAPSPAPATAPSPVPMPSSAIPVRALMTKAPEAAEIEEAQEQKLKEPLETHKALEASAKAATDFEPPPLALRPIPDPLDDRPACSPTLPVEKDLLQPSGSCIAEEPKDSNVEVKQYQPQVKANADKSTSGNEIVEAEKVRDASDLKCTPKLADPAPPTSNKAEYISRVDQTSPIQRTEPAPEPEMGQDAQEEEDRPASAKVGNADRLQKSNETLHREVDSLREDFLRLKQQNEDLRRKLAENGVSLDVA
eukprot:gnl/MRDRNA2_/MRDRNA2_58652_c0_seq1.p1 gnl/MRDRNA2_/MRDRNA2_58652_c0~~gnl/MRDRNA2_/MRDRNA2_58652_c0_seq1.p1  ORF type:complete len:480 (-),score=107.64 gnl/MRDRNA2_/MRDRNA2_58652_c0_seq1:43-1482(-)